MRRKLALGIAGAFLLVSAVPADAATVTVTMKALDFHPPIARARIGDTVAWANSASDRHSTTSSGPTPWDSGNLPSWGGRYNRVFPIAGSFPYYCTLHKSLGMTGAIKVATQVSPTTGTRSTNFVVTLAKTGTKPPTGFSYVLQKALGSGAYSTAAVTTSASTTFRATSTGTYKLRAGLQRNSGAYNTAWFSDPVTITVR